MSGYLQNGQWQRGWYDTRKTRGDDVDAACGQLAGQVRDRTRRTIAIRSAREVHP